MKKKLNKKWLFSLFSIPLVALPIGLSTLNNTNKSISLVSKSLNVNESTTDSSINLNDALPVTDTSLSSFGSYIVSYEDNNVAPVNVTIPMTDAETNTVKAGGATVGMTASKQTITLTTYAGLLLWSHKLTDNQLLKNYYSTVKTVSDISTYKVINFAYLESKNILFVLFGEEKTADNGNTLENLVVFGLDINSGAIVVPSNAELSKSQVITQARNNSAFIFFNSADQLVVTSGKLIADINSTSKIMSFDDKTGFANVKGNDETTNNFGLPTTNNGNNNQGIAVKASDYFLGFLPSSVPGVNFSFWLYDSGTSNNVTLSYATGKNSPNKQVTNSYKYFNYYVVALDDNFQKINIGNAGFYVLNRDATNSVKRGYINASGSLSTVDFNDITKRFFVTGSSEASGTTTESFGILIDSFDAMFSSFVNYSIDITATGDTKTVAVPTTTRMFMNYDASTATLPASASVLPANLANTVTVNNYEFNSVGYDAESNFVYFSLSGQELNYTNDAAGDPIPGKYLTNTRYIDLKPETTSNNVSSDAYVESSPYTLSDVNFNTYVGNDLYLIRQTIDGSEGEWLSTTLTDFNDDTKDFTPTAKPDISFTSLETLADELEKSTALDSAMPSLLGENLGGLEQFLQEKEWTNTVKFINATGDDKTGEINLQTQITYPNNFGDTTELDKGSVSYQTYIQVTGFTMNDFSLTFKNDTDATVVDIKKQYSAEEMAKNKTYVINHLLQNFTVAGVTYTPAEDTVTLSNPTTSSLKIEVKVPIKTSATDANGILPFGFPESDSTVTMEYQGFTGTQSPPNEQSPSNPNNPNSPNNSGERLSSGEIAGIVTGSLALAAIVTAAIVIIRMRSKSKVAVV